MGFGNLSIFASGGGGSSGDGVAKYATAAALPAVASDGDLAIVLDTNYLYTYDTGIGAWVAIAGPGAAITVSDTTSVDLTLTGNVLSADLNVAGMTSIASTQGITLAVGVSGLFAYVNAYPVYGVTSTSWNILGSTAAVLGATLQLDIPPASTTNSGLINTDSQSFSGTKFFNSPAIGFSGFGIVSGGPETIYLLAPAVVPSTYQLYLPTTPGPTYGFMQTDGQGNLSFVTGESISIGFTIGDFSYVSFSRGATFNGPTFTLGWADLTNPGGVGVTTQQFAGLKLFNENIVSPTVSGSTAASGNLTLNSTLNATPGNVLLNIGMGNSGCIGIGMTNPQAAIHFGAGVTNLSLSTVGSNAVVLGRLNPNFGIAISSFLANGNAGANRAQGIDSAVFGASNNISQNGTRGFITGLGNNVQATNGVAHGADCQVLQQNGMAIGNVCFAQGQQTFAAGEGAIAQGRASTVIGSYNNIEGSTSALTLTDSVFIVGNGPSSGVRKNAFAVTRDAYQKWYGVTSGFLSMGVGASLAGYTLVMPLSQGATLSVLQNDGLGNLSWSTSGSGTFDSVSAANYTATSTTRFIGVTTTTSDRSIGIDFISGITGAVVTVQKVDSGLGNILVGATQGINGASIMIISGQWSKISFTATGSGFYA